MSTAEFVRLRPDPDDQSENPRKREFVCELPDADEQNEDNWLDCGRVSALASGGHLRQLDVQLTDLFMAQFDGRQYDPEEVAYVIVLWVGWESGWTPLDKVLINLSDSGRSLRCVYTTAVDRVTILNQADES